jgi:uncharacterized oxidoreductase
MPIFQGDFLQHVAQEVFRACGAPTEEAAIVAEHLVVSSLMGVESHGVIRIIQYVREIEKGVIKPGASVTVAKETDTTAVVDCGWNFGQVGAVRAMEVAMHKAAKERVAVVVTQRCGHAGRLGAYTQLAAQTGFLAIGACNSPRHGHFVLPWGGREGRLATNPFSFAAPTDCGHPILADFSTGAVPEGKIRFYQSQGKALPEGWIVDARGRPSTNPSDFYGPPRGAILPFGRETGYRGYALSLLVEVLGGVLAGQDITVDQPGNGVVFIVIDVSAFLPREQYNHLIAQLRTYLKGTPPAEGFEAVLLPGEPEFRTAEARRGDGIVVDERTWGEILGCAHALGVEGLHEKPIQK